MIVQVKEEPYYSCTRCQITSLTPDRYIPCPRGGCEAEHVGKMVITVDITLVPLGKEKQQKEG